MSEGVFVQLYGKFYDKKYYQLVYYSDHYCLTVLLVDANHFFFHIKSNVQKTLRKEKNE